MKKGINTTTNTYNFLLGMFGSIAETERENIQERVVQDIEWCKETGTTKTGRWIGEQLKTTETCLKTLRSIMGSRRLSK